MTNPDRDQSIRDVAFSVVAHWKESLPDFPWDAVAQLTSVVILKYPQIFLLTNDQAKKIASEEGISWPPRFSVDDIASRTNPTIAKTRSTLS